MRDFGDTLRSMRTAQNISQDELAAAMGVTKSSISLWENGTIPRYPEIVGRIFWWAVVLR